MSPKEQEREGYSIPAQWKLLCSYAQKHGYEIVREFIDVETAKQCERTQFNNMVGFLGEHPKVRIILEQGIKLIEIARNAYHFFQSKSKPEQAELIRFILPDSQLRDGKIVPDFKPPFDIIWRLAQETKQYHPDIKKQTVEGLSIACSIILPAVSGLNAKSGSSVAQGEKRHR